jgi:hypothetical protein
MIAVTPTAPLVSDLATSSMDRSDVRRPGLVQGLLDLIAAALGRDPDLHGGDDAHALDDEDEVDAF